MNGSKFFGLKYEDVPQELRDDACKRIIYGAGYNMTAPQLLRRMGEKAVDKAKILLKLPKHYSRLETCDFLLNTYNIAYPEVKGPNYEAIKALVMSTHMLTSSLGWTRYCFGNPARNRHDFNAYVAHVPANLSVGVLNRGFIRSWQEVKKPNSRYLRFKAQIHDSIFGQVRVGYEYLVPQVRQIVQQKVMVKDLVHGIERMMEIPVAMKISKPGGSWADCKKWNGKIETLPT